jgi:energy-converting hydrogenase Eha subunit A
MSIGTARFKAKRISCETNLLFPEEIIITGDKVTILQRQIIGYQTTDIDIDNIASVSVNAGLLFSDIIIETYGGMFFRVDGFSRSDASDIVRLLRKKNWS